jgi:heme A synthase
MPVASPSETRVHAGAFARYAWGVLAYNVAVILWGALVRATGSGAGCGNHWPNCGGELVPHAPGTATMIEFTHRAMTGLDVPLVALLVIWAFRAFPKGHLARLAAGLAGVFLVTEALIGAALVKLEHVAQNAASARAWSLSAHLINTLTLLACLTLTAWWASNRHGVRIRGRDAWLAGVSMLTVVLLGITGVIAALGDTLFPSTSLVEGWARDWDPASNIFLRLRGIHPLIAAMGGSWLLVFAVSSASRKLEARQPAGMLAVVVAAQILAGGLNLVLLAPIPMQILHLLLADLLWISLVMLCAALLQKGPRLA